MLYAYIFLLLDDRFIELINNKNNTNNMGNNYDSWLDQIGFGGWGLWQMSVFFFVAFSQFFQSMTNMAIVFMQIKPDFKCTSFNGTCSRLEGCEQTDECSRTVKNVSFDCTEWKYDQSVMIQSVVSQWNLICGQEVRIADAQMIFMVGTLLGSLLSGYASDRWGRKKVIVASGVLTGLMGVCQARSPYLSMFLTFRFLLAFFNTACYLTGYVLCLEITSSNYRDVVGGLFYVPYAVGYVSLSAVAYFIRDWRHLQTIVAVPVLINALYFWALPESPRWLMSHGRYSAARKVLIAASKVNAWVQKKKESSINPEDLEIAEEKDQKEQLVTTNDHEESKSGSFWLMFNTVSAGIRTVSVWYIWLIVSMVYYGVSLNVTSLTGDVFVNNALAGAVEIPAYILVVPLLRWGRKKSLLLSLVLLSSILIISPLLPKSMASWSYWMYMIGKGVVTAVFAIIFVVTAELYPTIIRNTAVAVGSTVARVGSALAPYTALLSQLGASYESVPFFIWGGLSIVASLIVITFPETKGKPLPENDQDLDVSQRTAEPMGNGKRILNNDNDETKQLQLFT